MELSIDTYRQFVDGMARQWPIVVVGTGAPEGRSALQVAAVGSDTGNGISIYRRGDDGTGRVWRDMWTTEAPAG